MYAIWDFDLRGWVRELPSKVNDGGEAILVFASLRKARERAAQHFGYDAYAPAEKDGYARF